jgi:hypothetical protein
MARVRIELSGEEGHVELQTKSSADEAACAFAFCAASPLLPVHDTWRLRASGRCGT